MHVKAITNNSSSLCEKAVIVAYDINRRSSLHVEFLHSDIESEVLLNEACVFAIDFFAVVQTYVILR
jgi:hypothetical protein